MLKLEKGIERQVTGDKQNIERLLLVKSLAEDAGFVSMMAIDRTNTNGRTYYETVKQEVSSCQRQ